MKIITLPLLLLTVTFASNAQTISLSEFTPASLFQDADLGAMAFGDIDNDGDKDLIITGKGGPVLTTLYLNNGSGVFTVATGTSFTNVYGGTVGFEDVNNDGFLDLLITGNTSAPTKTAILYINNGNGTFSIAPNTPFLPSNEGDFAFADIDNDGDKDVIITGYYGTNNLAFTKLYTNNGVGVFTEVTNPFMQVKESSLAFIDIDNDSDQDVILAGKNDSGITATKLYTNNGFGQFTEVTTTPFVAIFQGDIAIADSDNDGDLDILLTGNSSPSPVTKLYINNGLGVFTEVIGTPFVGTFIGVTEFADLDNDGDKDILLLGATQGVPSATGVVYKNLGNGNFVFSNELIATYFASLAIADIDGDSDLDFIFGGTHFQGLIRNPKLYKNNLNPLAIETILHQNTISYYPNPIINTLTINSSKEMEQITLYNFLGQEVVTTQLKNTNFILDLDNQPAGTYIAKIKTGSTLESLLLIKK